jgi:outer membrane protein OmpA-like peptidoglycan-associated protein
LAYGQTEKNPSIKRLNPEDYGNSFGGQNGGGTGVTPIPPQPTDYDPIPDPFIKKITDTGNKLRLGCLENIWRIIRYLLFFLLIWFLFKTCNKIKNDDSTCDKANLEQIKVEKEKARLDSIKSGMNRNIEQAIANISEIYFYQNSTEFHISSVGVNGTLDRLSTVMKTFPDSHFSIIGHHSGTEIEQARIDQDRANKVFDYLVSKGVQRSQLETSAKGDLELKYDKEVSHDFEGRGFNNNMRVKVDLIK